MKRVLVTGGTGFIGEAAVKLLQERGFEIHLVGRKAPKDRGLAFYNADLLAPADVRAVVALIKPSHLLHLAWYAEPGLYWRSLKNLNWVAASLHLVQAFTEAGGTRAVVAGSCAEYEWGSPRFHERQSACIPATLYGAAKDGLRRVLEPYAPIAGLSFAWGRVFYLYGPGESSGRLVRDAITQLFAGERFPTSEGRQMRDFLHISDAAAAFVALLDSLVEGPVNIGSGNAVSVRALLETLAAIVGRSELLGFGERPLSPTEPLIIEADTRRLTDEVGFVPQFDLDRGLSQTVLQWHQRS